MSRALGYTNKKNPSGKDKPRWNPKDKQKNRDPDAMDVDFTQMSQEKKNQLMKSSSCFRCEKQGHLSRDCPTKNKASICEAIMEPPVEAPKEKGKKKAKSDDPPPYESLLKQINACSIEDRTKILEIFSKDGDSEPEDF